MSSRIPSAVVIMLLGALFATLTFRVLASPAATPAVESRGPAATRTPPYPTPTPTSYSPPSGLEQPSTTPEPAVIADWERSAGQVVEALRLGAEDKPLPPTLSPKVRGQVRAALGLQSPESSHFHSELKARALNRVVAFDPEPVSWEHIPVRDPDTLTLLDTNRYMALVAYLSGEITLLYPDSARRPERLNPVADHLIVNLEKQGGRWVVTNVADDGSLAHSNRPKDSRRDTR
ncbi:MAG: hypothetical protein M3Q29_16840 [Chloroflexota bacterium]|nr:hypothetical protein [Chloroflexota bacterium]